MNDETWKSSKKQEQRNRRTKNKEQRINKNKEQRTKNKRTKEQRTYNSSKRNDRKEQSTFFFLHRKKWNLGKRLNFQGKEKAIS